MVKHWFLLGLVALAFGLLSTPLYASPPDPGGKEYVLSAFSNSAQNVFLIGGTVERTTAAVPAFESAAFDPRAAFRVVTWVFGVALLALLAGFLLGPYFALPWQPNKRSLKYANVGPAQVPPERYDKAANTDHRLKNHTGAVVRQNTGRFRRQSS